MKKPSLLLPLFVMCVAFANTCLAANLYSDNTWSALTSDRIAHKVGDVLTVLVSENANATNSVNSNAKTDNQLGGQLSAGSILNGSANLDVNRQSANTGSTGRSDGMMAQISVKVDQVLPGGDLHVSGTQVLNINGERTDIRITGRVRLADISATNTVLSNHLADAAIDYDGSGYISRSALPGFATRIFDWLGLL